VRRFQTGLHIKTDLTHCPAGIHKRFYFSIGQQAQSERCFFEERNGCVTTTIAEIVAGSGNEAHKKFSLDPVPKRFLAEGALIAKRKSFHHAPSVIVAIQELNNACKL
jgi:hypothetical protein